MADNEGVGGSMETDSFDIRKPSSRDVENVSDQDDENDDSSDDMSDDEKALEGEASEYDKKITENPYDYNSYVELITCLKKMGELERLREAREKMSKHFPLTPELWMSWLQDEIKLAASASERKAVYDLFERAVQDYVSVDVWLEYAQFSIADMALEGGIDKIHTIFERALTAVGLHVARGAIMWEAYREFENIICTQNLGANDKDGGGQYGRVVKLFKRQLAVPLLDMENTYAEFHNWLKEVEETIDTKSIEYGYKKALSKLSKILPYEEQLLSCPTDGRSDCYRKYIDHEWTTDSDPARIQCLYERALAEDRTPDASLWLEYLEYLNNQLKIESLLLVASQRAIRNCPWNSSLWQHHLRALERCLEPHEKIKGALEAALVAGFVGASDYLELWLSYLDYLRRRVDFTLPEHADRIEELFAAFNKACEHLAQSFGLEGDPNCTILQYWARCEAIHRKNMTQSRLLWNDILSQGHDKTAAMWLEYGALERMYGTDKKHLRRLYARALNAVQDWPESIGTAWLNFERDEGTLNQFENCLMRFKERMKQVTAQREKAATQHAAELQESHEQRRNHDRGDRYQNKGNQDRKGKFQKPNNQPKRKHEDDEGRWSKVAPKTYVERTSGESSTEEKSTFRMPPPPGYKPSSERDSPLPPGYKGASEKSESPLKKMKVEDDQPQESSTFVHNTAKDDRTVFLSNLDFNTTEDTIRERFSDVGPLTDIRLVRNFKGRSKGFGYLEFSTPKEAQEALKKDREMLEGRPMFVSKCDSDAETRQKVFKYSSNLEKNKLFIRDLPFSTTQEELEEMYKPFGTLKDVRLVTYRNGHSKGLAYVEFEESASAANALLKTDGMVIKDRTLQVSLSKPPERKVQPSASLIPSLGGGGEREIGGRGRVKLASSLLPRSLRMAKGASSSTPAPNAEPSAANGNAAGGDRENEASRKTMSNQDFRQMLLGSKK